MVKIEEENYKSVIEAAGGVVAPEQPTPKAQPAAPHAPESKKKAEKKPMEETKPTPAPEPATTPAPTAPAPAAQESAPPQVAASQAPEAQSASPQVITIDDFAKVELRVAQVLVAERIPKADKLLRLEVDLGYEKRQILAGIAQYYEPEKLIGRKIVIVANLAPRKMRGLESNGMLLAASLPPDGAPVLAGFLEDVPLGARLK